MRYTGPKVKQCRREGYNLFGTEKYDLSTNHRKLLGGKVGKLSDFGVQLRKKQAAKRTYALNERQFASYFKKALKMQGETGESMLRLLDLRLDSVVYRGNFARTIMQARQLVNHSHFTVNGKKSTIPSLILQQGDIIQLKEKMKESPLYKALIEEFQAFSKKNASGTISAVKWLEVDPAKLTITIKSLPQKEDFDQLIDIQKIVEFYSK